MKGREHAHELIDRLPEVQLTAVVGLLEAMVDPVEAALANAPEDDEPETESEARGAAEAREWLANRGGVGISQEEAMRRLGLD
jgi:hypothetical protein